MKEDRTEPTSREETAVLPLNEQHAAGRVPLATYRLQFHRSFTFADAARLVPYLYALGVSDCYASPYFKARPGSAHGYDVLDHTTLNPEVGSEAEYEAFVTELQQHNMGQLLDVVPNHMGIAEGKNPLWTDVLENGPSSLYAPFFDIDWTPVKDELADKVLLPILGDQYGHVLENQELVLQYDDGAFFLRYYEYRLPIAPRPTVEILQHRIEALQQSLGAEDPHFLELQSILTALRHLPQRTETDPEKVAERTREKRINKRRLATLTATCSAIAAFVTENVRQFNGDKSDLRSFDALDRLLADQAYRLAHWRVAAEEINYRRFFDINELAAIRTEDPMVFVATHQLVLRLLAERKVTGLRIDHVDGLYDPLGYLRRLQQAAGIALHRGTWPPLHFGLFPPDESEVRALLQENGHTNNSSKPAELPCYVATEKILGAHEELPDWPIHGTSGYEFLGVLNGIFIAQENERRFNDLYIRFTHLRVDFPELVYQSKRLIMQVSLSSEINVLAHQLNRLSEQNRSTRDFTLNSLRQAIREIVACFPVYRTYIDERGVTEHDQTIIETAVARAKRKNPAMDVSVFNFVRDVLLLRRFEPAGALDREAQLTFVMKFQQCTSPVMAKGLEDTAFYRYHRLASLNEVGGAPERFGISLDEFHRQNRQRQQHWPHSLLATATHDTKRGEDVRARINVLSEIPQDWRAALSRWSKLNKKKKPLIEGQPVPDRNEEYLLYQTLLGAWPFTLMNADEYGVFKQRIQDYMQKATKEAKVHTSWINPNQAYDDALRDFVGAVLDGSLFLDDFQALRDRVAQCGIYNSLSQTLLKLTVPGVPDIYQGTELWDFSLVDPDNRRPVDYQHRQQLLRALQERINAAGPDLSTLVRELLEQRIDGRIKLYVTHRALTYRRAHSELFRHSVYLPVETVGSRQQHVCAFARRHEGKEVLVVAPRFFTRLIADAHALPLGSVVWEDTSLLLPADSMGHYYNVLTGESVAAISRDGKNVLALGNVLAHCPVALLESVP